MNQPIISFRSNSAPYSVISPISYVQSAIGGNNLPVKEGENSNLAYFRIYNNFNASAGIGDMYNVAITVFDGMGIASHTANQSPTAQSWLRIYETGFGESTTAPGAYTQWMGQDTAIGRSGIDLYIPEYGSDGTVIPYIRAGSDTNGVGFIEFATYAQIPAGAGFATYALAISLFYDWTP